MYRIKYFAGNGWAVLCNIVYIGGFERKHIWILAEHIGKSYDLYAYPLLFHGDSNVEN
jgi:hypothetical protein